MQGDASFATDTVRLEFPLPLEKNTKKHTDSGMSQPHHKIRHHKRQGNPQPQESPSTSSTFDLSTETPCTIKIQKLAGGSAFTARMLPFQNVTVPWARILGGQKQPLSDSMFEATIGAEDGRQVTQRFPYTLGLDRMRIMKGERHPYIYLSSSFDTSDGTHASNWGVKYLSEPDAAALRSLDRHAAYLDLLALGDQERASEIREDSFYETMESVHDQELESFPFRGELLVRNEVGENVTITTWGSGDIGTLIIPLGKGRILRTGWAAIHTEPHAILLVNLESDPSTRIFHFVKSTWLSTLTVKKEESGVLYAEAGTDFAVPQGVGVRGSHSMEADLPLVSWQKSSGRIKLPPGKWRQVVVSNLSNQDIQVALSSEVSGENLISTTVYSNEDLHHIWDFLKGEVDLPPRLGDPMEVRVRCGKHSAKYAFNYNPAITRMKLLGSEAGVSVQLEYDTFSELPREQLLRSVNFRRVGLSASDEKTLTELANLNTNIRRNNRRPAIRLSPIFRDELPPPPSQWLPADLYEDVSPPSNKGWPLCIRNTGPACTIMLANNYLTNQVGDSETLCTSWQQAVPLLKEETCKPQEVCIESSDGKHLRTYLIRPTPLVRVLTIKHTSTGPRITLEDNWKDESGAWATEDAEQSAKLGEKEAELTPIANDPSAIAALTLKKNRRYASAIVEAAKRRGMRIELDDVLSIPLYPGPGIHPQPSEVGRGSDRVYQPERQESLSRLVIRLPENNTFSFVVSVEGGTPYMPEGAELYETEGSQRLLDAPPLPGVSFFSLNRKKLIDDMGFGMHLRISAKDEKDNVTTTSFPVTPQLHHIALEKDSNGRPRVHPRYFRWVNDARRVVVSEEAEGAFMGRKVMRTWRTPCRTDVRFLKSPEHMNKKLEDVEERWFDPNVAQSSRYSTNGDELWKRPVCELAGNRDGKFQRRRRSALLREESLLTETRSWREGGEGLHKMATKSLEDEFDVRQRVRSSSKAKDTTRQSSETLNKSLLEVLGGLISLVPFGGGALGGGRDAAIVHG